MDLKKSFGVNAEKAEEGVWFSVDERASIKVAKIGTLKYQRALMKHTQKYQALIRINRLSAEHLTKVTVLTLADAVLLDWREFEEDGKPLFYSKEAAIRILEEYPDFRAYVEQCGNNIEEFQEGDVEADAKNSLHISAGS